MIQPASWLAANVDAASVAALHVGVGVMHLDDATLLQVEQHQPRLDRLQTDLARHIVHYTKGRYLVVRALLFGVIYCATYLLVAAAAVVLIEHGETIEHIIS